MRRGRSNRNEVEIRLRRRRRRTSKVMMMRRSGGIEGEGGGLLIRCVTGGKVFHLERAGLTSSIHIRTHTHTDNMP